MTLSHERGSPLGIVPERFMYWDIAEVTPKPDHCLFVRFKDGLEGLVRLREEQLTGVLAACGTTSSSNRCSSMRVWSLALEKSIWRPTRCTLKPRGRTRQPSSRHVDGSNVVCQLSTHSCAASAGLKPTSQE